MPQLLISAFILFVFYLTVRKAVTHGILEADEVRAERARSARIE